MPIGIYKRKNRPLHARFDEKFSIPYPPDDKKCWPWKARISPFGYGQFAISPGNVKQAHRFSYELYVGKIPNGMCVLHKCDNRKCVNPKHLWLGTQKENIQDMIKKGRAIKATGERNGGAKLRWQEVTEIRDLYKTGRFSYNDFARKYHVSESTIKRLMTNKTWK